jgi:hypothetical protein
MTITIGQLTAYFTYACDLYVSYYRRRHLSSQEEHESWRIDLTNPQQNHFTWNLYDSGWSLMSRSQQMIFC